ncbi:MAG: Nudix family hydrolase [Betaproteobacteria bacterium]|nr:Nudix family hydrolase [Betaproteobacteria bacterium]
MSSNFDAAADPSPVARHSSPSRVEVAAAVVLREDGTFLLGQRPAGKPYGGYWEFPGGKVEADETPLAALTRELHEELGIEVKSAHPWLTRDYDYAHAAVRLRFFRVMRWSGELHGRENQRFVWQSPAAVDVGPLLPANAPILRALRLPPVYGITNAAALGRTELLRRLQRALDRGLKLLQVREKSLAPDELRGLAAEVVRLAHASGARVLVNADAALAQRVGADGVHLTAAQLARIGARPELELVGASCHDAEELARAAALGVDLVVLGPVLPTPSHPEARGMGWKRFAAMVRDYPLPVYALGGLNPPDLETAWRSGAHGISMMRAAWAA